MKIGLYQMINQGLVNLNYSQMEKGIVEASKKKCDVIIFPECALTGYPPVENKLNLHLIENDVLFYERKLKKLAKDFEIYLIFGTIRYEKDKRYNSLKVINHQGELVEYYDKRALWGYDLTNFEKGLKYKKVEINGVIIGLSICFEIRFPEFYREHKKNEVDVMLTCFCDISSDDNKARYDLIKGHIRTRAVENVIPHLSVNSATRYQTAPTGVYDIYGNEVIKTDRNVNQLLVYTYEKQELGYGVKGILEISKSFSEF